MFVGMTFLKKSVQSHNVNENNLKLILFVM